MIPNYQLQAIIAATGRPYSWLARMLGYASKSSLQQAEAGKQSLPENKLQWLERYARMRQRLETAEADWLEKNPPPNGKSY